MTSLPINNHFPKSNGIFLGDVFHSRKLPKSHRFVYSMFMFWMDLDDLEQEKFRQENLKAKGLFKAFNYQKKDYFFDSSKGHKQELLEILNDLSDEVIQVNKVFMLGQIRSYGIYFSPVNFYFIEYEGQLTHMLVEVSNTPWNEKHCYLVNLDNLQPTNKEFHVSPFMNLNMHYKWQVSITHKNVQIVIENWKKEKLFSAGFDFNFMSLDQNSLKQVSKRWPIMGLSIFKSIYWQALKLFIKRVPFYSHTRGSK